MTFHVNLLADDSHETSCLTFSVICLGMVGWCEGVLYLRAPGRPIDIGLQLGKACYPCSR